MRRQGGVYPGQSRAGAGTRGYRPGGARVRGGAARILIRAAWPGDAAAITDVVTAAFGREDEARLIAMLDADGDTLISLVAVEAGEVVGHVLLSRMEAPFPALGLAPLSVRPDCQHRSLGAALMRAGIAEATKIGARAIFLLGDPGFYGRFGFSVPLARGFANRWSGAHFMVLPIGGPLPVITGRVEYAPAFAALGGEEES